MRSSRTDTRGGSRPPAFNDRARSRADIHDATCGSTIISPTSEVIAAADIHDVSPFASTERAARRIA